MVAVGVVLGLAAGVAAGYAYWGRAARAAGERLVALEASAAQVQSERERLHGEVSDILRERHEMARAAEHLRSQVEQQLRRLETLAEELAPPHPEGGEPMPDEPPPAP